MTGIDPANLPGMITSLATACHWRAGTLRPQCVAIMGGATFVEELTRLQHGIVELGTNDSGGERRHTHSAQRREINGGDAEKCSAY